MKFFFITFFLIFTAACGKNSTGSDKNTSYIVPATSADEIAEIVSTPGIYEISISSLNPKVVRFSAKGTLIQDENEITVSINAKKISPLRSTHQIIYEGECPTSADDRNGDGKVDIGEAEIHLIKPLVPLDTDINSSSENHSGYPTSNLFGKYSYKVKGNKLQIQSDIQKKFGSLKVDWQKSVVIFFLTGNENLPLACGKISLK